MNTSPPDSAPRPAAAPTTTDRAHTGINLASGARLQVSPHPPHILTVSFPAGHQLADDDQLALLRFITDEVQGTTRNAIAAEWRRHIGPDTLPLPAVGQAQLSYPVHSSDIAAQVAKLARILPTYVARSAHGR